MRRKTTEIYRLIFQRIKQLSPALQGSLRITMADFEAAIAAAIQAEFPEVNITGCDFHFKQVSYFLKKTFFFFKFIILVL